MPTLSRRAVIATAITGAVAIGVPATLAASSGGGGVPANKAVAAASYTQHFPVGQETPLLSAHFKTSKPEDLLISVSLECSILTNTVITGGTVPNLTESTSAHAAIRVWTELDGVPVSLQSASAPPQDGSTKSDDGKVTFCDRLNERSVSDAENPKDGIDGSTDYLETKDANAFNWVLLNAGSGEHDLVVKAELTANAAAPSDADGWVGNRTLVIEPTKLANNAVIGDPGTSGAGQP